MSTPAAALLVLSALAMALALLWLCPSPVHAVIGSARAADSARTGPPDGARPDTEHPGPERGQWQEREQEQEARRAWPVAGEGGSPRPVVVHGWRPPPTPWAAGHRGVDLATRAGRPVRAAGAGRVSFAGPVAGRGVVATELSGTGDPPLRTTYEPVRASVHKGERVRAGDVVGTVQPGRFHCGTACLHWGLLRGDRYLNPLSLLPPHMLRGGPARLLPFSGVPEPRSEPRGGDGGRPDTPETVAARSSTSGGTGPLVAGLALAAASVWAHRRLRRRRPSTRTVQPRTPPRAMDTAASVICAGSSAAPSSIRRTAASTTPWSSIAASRG